MRSERVLIVAALAAGLLNGATRAARADGWVGSWGASDVFPVGQDINYQTLREFVRLSAGGKEARVRFSNATGPLSARHRRGACGEARRRRLAQERSIRRPTMRLPSEASRRGHDRARRGGGVRSGRDGSPAVIDARGKLLHSALDGAVGDSSRRGRDHLHFRRRRLHGSPPSFRRRKPQRPVSSSTRSTSRRPAMQRRSSRLATPSPTAIARRWTATIAGLTGSRNDWRPGPTARLLASSTPASAAIASCMIAPRICSARALWRGSIGTCCPCPE